MCVQLTFNLFKRPDPEIPWLVVNCKLKCPIYIRTGRPVIVATGSTHVSYVHLWLDETRGKLHMHVGWIMIVLSTYKCFRNGSTLHPWTVRAFHVL